MTCMCAVSVVVHTQVTHAHSHVLASHHAGSPRTKNPGARLHPFLSLADKCCKMHTSVTYMYTFNQNLIVYRFYCMVSRQTTHWNIAYFTIQVQLETIYMPLQGTVLSRQMLFFTLLWVASVTTPMNWPLAHVFFAALKIIRIISKMAE